MSLARVALLTKELTLALLLWQLTGVHSFDVSTPTPPTITKVSAGLCLNDNCKVLNEVAESVCLDKLRHFPLFRPSSSRFDRG